MKTKLLIISLLLGFQYGYTQLKTTGDVIKSTANSFILDQPLDNNTSYEYTASNYINLEMGDLTGFGYLPTGDNYFEAKTDPLMVIPPTIDTTIGPPSNNKGGIPGTIPGTFTVSATGSANYNIPISVPGGTKGMTPGISLNYSSGGGEGLMGEGWRLGGLSVINRSPFTYYYNDTSQTVVFDETDQLLLDGKHLIKINDNEYRTEKESFTKVVPINGNINNGFLVYHPDGKISKYGSGSNSRQVLQSCPQPVAWYVDTIFDASDNYIAFEYNNDPDYGFIYPHYIRYTGNTNTGTGTFYRIEFSYENNFNTPKMYFYNANTYYTGLFSQVTKRLIGIKCRYLPSWEVINEYNLNYVQKGLFNKYYFKSVTHKDTYGNYFNPSLFEWNINSYSPANNTSGFIDENFEETSMIYNSDFNQDGKSDLIHFYTNPDTDKETFKIHMNNGFGHFNWIPDFTYEFYYPVISFQTGDFNGDGINDIFYTYMSDANYVKGKIMYLDYDESSNTFTTTSSSDRFNLSLATYSNPRFIISDFTGNSLMDCGILYDADGTFSKILIYISEVNEPLGGYVSIGTSQWYHPEYYFAKDFDGDNKSELLLISDAGSKIFELSNNNQLIVRYDAPDEFSNTTGQIVSGDFNKDGKADILLLGYDSQNNVRLFNSFGKGFVAAPSLTINNIISGVGKSMSLDLNGDKYDDLSIIKVLWGSGSIPDKYIRIDYLTKPDGKSFLPGDTLILQEPAGNTSLNTLKYTWGEFYNSGLIDLVTIDTNSSSKYRIFFDNLNKSFTPVSKITNGFGEEIKIEYSQIDYYSGYSKGIEESFPVSSISSGLPVVTQYEMETGSGSSTYFVQLNYKGAKYHRYGKGFLGFDEFTIINSAKGKTTTTYNSHSNPYFHVQTDSIKQWLTSSGKLTNRDVYTNFYYDYGDKRFFNYVSESTSEKFNQANQLSDYYFEDLHYILDNDGIPVKIEKNSKKELGGEWVNKYSDISLLNFTSNSKWILGLQDTIKTTHTSYDENPINRLTVKEYDSQTGYLTKTIIEPNNQKKTETSIDYDIYGNIVKSTLSATGLNDRFDSSLYMNNGRFLKKSINTLGFETVFEYYEKTGNLKKTTDANGLQATFYYDGFGRKIKTITPNGNESHNLLLWSFGHPDAPSNALYYSWSQISGKPATLVFFDKLGRELRNVSIAFDGRKIYTDKEYYSSTNKIGLLNRVSNPYFTDSIPNYTTYTYDNLRRQHIVTSPDGTTTTFTYGIKEVTTTLHSGTETRIKKKKLDAAGRLVYTKDITNNESVDNNYYSNGLLKETWVNGHDETKISYRYDIFSNLDSIIDPNQGILTKTYNAFNDVLSEKDGNGNITHYNYDISGRMIKRIENDGITDWYYDTKPHGIGKIDYVTYVFADANADVTVSKDEYFYDNLGRDIRIEQEIDGEIQAFEKTYDIFGRLKKTTYPSTYYITNYYNAYGYLGKIKGPDNKTLWEAGVVNSIGKIQDFNLGQNIHSSMTYNPDNFRLRSIKSGKNTDVDLQNLAYDWKPLGNLHYRRDYNKGVYEFFTYDNFDRLTHCTVNNVVQLQQSYTDLGNIFSKSDVGLYQYGQNGAGPNAVTTIQNPASPYLNTQQQIDYTTFNKVVKITEGDTVLNMAYGYGHNRIKQLIDHGDGTFVKKTWFGSSFEKIEYSDGTYEELHYLSSPGGVFGILTIDQMGNKTLNYILKDHLGSINMVLSENGDVVEEVNFDAWGRLRNPSDWTYSNAPTSTLFDRGYTMHEHLWDFNLINMNGRVFDPVIARFLSPDPSLQEPGNTQNHNRYSYTLNNPLKYTDPSGYNFIDDLGSCIEGFLTIITIPGRVLAGANAWVDDWANHSPDPNGYFSAEYILNGVLPAPSSGFFALFEPGSGSGMLAARGNGFAAADGTFYSNGYLADEGWANYAANHQVWEQGDFNNMDVLAALDMQTRINNMIANAATGLMYAGPGLTDPPNKNGDGTVEEKKGSDGGDIQVQEAAIFALPLLYEATAALVGAAYLSYQIYTSRGNPKPVISTYAKDGKPPYWRNPGGLLMQFATAALVTAVILDRISPQTQNINENPLDFNSKYNPSDMILPISDPGYWNSLTERQKIGYMNNVINNN